MYIYIYLIYRECTEQQQGRQGACSSLCKEWYSGMERSHIRHLAVQLSKTHPCCSCDLQHVLYQSCLKLLSETTDKAKPQRGGKKRSRTPICKHLLVCFFQPSFSARRLASFCGIDLSDATSKRMWLRDLTELAQEPAALICHKSRAMTAFACGMLVIFGVQFMDSPVSPCHFRQPLPCLRFFVV